MENRISLIKKKVPGSSRKTKRPAWLWGWHYLVPSFVFFFGVGLLLGAFQFSDIKFRQAGATSADYVMGWIWADPIGWISMNDTNPGACPVGPCGTYGVTVDTVTREMTGFAWSDKAGWICFGKTCGLHTDCNNGSSPPPALPPPVGALNASISSGVGMLDVHGWAKVCNENDDGWVSLNCTDAGACGMYAYKVKYNSGNKTFNGRLDGAHPMPNNESLAWNGNLSGTGFGYVDFQFAWLNTPTENPPEVNCHDGLDNDMDGLVDCDDASCKPTNTCNQSIWTNTDSVGNPICKNGKDDDGTGVDCASPRCKGSTECQEILTNTDFFGTNMCVDTIDDDGDGAIDCVDVGCTGYFACAAGEPTAGPGACSDTVDNDSNGQTDCDDANCQLFDPVCTPAWLSAKFGNVYAQQGISGTASKPSTATYCLTSNGAITGFTSGSGCAEATSGAISLPKTGTGYKGSLGSLDIPGILAGRYGTVKELVVGGGDITAQVDSLLVGKVYHVVGNVSLNAKIFQNGVAATQRGNGLLIVEGNLNIIGNLDYQAVGAVSSLRNLASFGVIVKKNGAVGGNITISPTVTKIVGAYFAEESISTGSVGPVDVPLDVVGLMAAHQINLQRNYRDPARAAETVTFDGRAVANPPPGMADISQSLPTSKDAF